MSKPIYYLPGARGLIHTGLGQVLIDRGYTPYGRETVGEFKKLRFNEQLDLIIQDLETMFWSTGAHVIANSYGAYLFLNAQAIMKPYIGKVLLLSPIVGEFSNEEHMKFFVPPRDTLI
jgi:alpha-beta hydrolase superfamily lysophospholipase